MTKMSLDKKVMDLESKINSLPKERKEKVYETVEKLFEVWNKYGFGPKPGEEDKKKEMYTYCLNFLYEIEIKSPFYKRTENN
jgi:hypothetical protein